MRIARKLLWIIAAAAVITIAVISLTYQSNARESEALVHRAKTALKDDLAGRRSSDVVRNPNAIIPTFPKHAHAVYVGKDWPYHSSLLYIDASGETHYYQSGDGYVAIDALRASLKSP